MLKDRTFYIVRHCESEANRDSYMSGQYDVALTDTGIAQARNLAAILAERVKPHVDYIVSSPLQRARYTAEYMNAHAKLPVIHDRRIQEQHFGELQGRYKAEVRGREHALQNPPGGEPYDTFTRRVLDGLNHYLEQPGKPLFCSHGGVFRVISQYTGLDCADPGNGAIYAITAHSAEDKTTWHLDICD